MARTNHMRERMVQRNILDDDINLTKMFGTRKGEKIVLSKKNCINVSESIDKFIRQMDRFFQNNNQIQMREIERIKL